MTKYCTILMLTILSCSEYSSASGPSTLEEQVAFALKNRANQEAAISAALNDADSIFSGYVLETWKDHELKRVYVEFEIDEIHRGHPGFGLGYYDQKNSARYLRFESESEKVSETGEMAVDLGRVCIRCAPRHDQIHPFEQGYRYLVYIVGDRIIRQNMYYDWVPLLDAEQELEAIDHAAHNK